MSNAGMVQFAVLSIIVAVGVCFAIGVCFVYVKSKRSEMQAIEGESFELGGTVEEVQVTRILAGISEDVQRLIPAQTQPRLEHGEGLDRHCSCIPRA